MTTPDLGQCPACGQWMQIPVPAPFPLLICPWCECPTDMLQLERVPVRLARAIDFPAPSQPAGPATTSDAEVDTSSLLASRSPSPFQVDPGPGRRRQVPRSGRRLAVELVKIVAGGLAGLLIAQLILWWIPGIGRRDPLGLAQHVPPWLSSLVPPELRPPK
jgi:hypothetical protein